MLDWAPLERLQSELHASRRGRPSYPPLTMFKALLLATWYQLSDVQLEEALWDRLSFRRFVGLSWEDPTPDHSTVSRFRTALAEAELGPTAAGRVGATVGRTRAAGQAGHDAGREHH